MASFTGAIPTPHPPPSSIVRCMKYLSPGQNGFILLLRINKTGVKCFIEAAENIFTGGILSIEFNFKSVPLGYSSSLSPMNHL